MFLTHSTFRKLEEKKELKTCLISECLLIFLVTGWSAPSAIGIAGLGGGFEIGVEVNLWSCKVFF